MTPHEADNDLWKLEYTCKINQYYYEVLAGRWGLADWVAKSLSTILGIAGIVFFAIDRMRTHSPESLALDTAFSLLGIGIFLALMIVPVDICYRHHRDLRRRWTDLLARCERLHIALRASRARQISHSHQTELQALHDEKNAVEKDEWRAHEQLLQWCQQEINKRTYTVDQGTYAETMEKIRENQEVGTVPQS